MALFFLSLDFFYDLHLLIMLFYTFWDQVLFLSRTEKEKRLWKLWIEHTEQIEKKTTKMADHNETE